MDSSQASKLIIGKTPLPEGKPSTIKMLTIVPSEAVTNRD